MSSPAMLLRISAVAALLLVGASGAKVTPTQQVISMMSEMKAKGENMLESEQKTYDTYAEWVDDESKRLAFEIQDGQKKIEELIAFIDKADSDVAELGRQIDGHNGEIDKLSGQKQEATDNRKEEHEEYLKVSQDYGESVDALERAIQVSSAQNYDRAQAEMLLQKMSVTVPGMPRVLAAFLQEKSRSSLRGRASGEEPGAPEVAAYEFQSGGIVALLEGLHKKFKGELADVEEAESNQAHEFSLVEIHLSDTIAKETSDRDEKTVTKGKKAAASAKAKGELAETKKDKAADEKLKAQIEATFQEKTASFQQNQEVRKQELEAIAKAIEIISSPEVAGSYAKHVNLAQEASGRTLSFLQTGRAQQHLVLKNQALALLRNRAQALGSETLARAATQLSANPSFAKVIDMIEDLLEKLKAEAAAEAEHQAWCDEQLKANKLKRNKKTAKSNKLIAEIEGLTADIADMGKEMKTLMTEQQELTKAMKEATEQREAEHEENTATIADAAAGMEAVKKALVILKEFYSSQASLLQQNQVPEMAAYKGMQSNKGGIIGMLEVIQTDFTRLKAETEASEASAAAEYKTFMEVSTASKKAKHEAEFKLSLDKDQSEFEQENTEKDLRATQAELAKANKYFKYLKPSCLEVHVSWEERVAKRKEELAALKQAWTILDQKSKE